MAENVVSEDPQAPPLDFKITTENGELCASIVFSGRIALDYRGAALRALLERFEDFAAEHERVAYALDLELRHDL